MTQIDMPILYTNRDIVFEPETLKKLKYLNYKKKGKPDRYSDIVNEALATFFEREFPSLEIELYVDTKAIEQAKKHKEMLKEQAKDKDNARVLKLAKVRIIEREIEAIRQEEKESGKKIIPPKDIKRQLHEYKW